ncbi:hypothetical protein DVH24_032982 [Malus domestica]|uniref:Uncharacterized protein n=1 Tax=Malus domestica TaxID=3750 RepID=A0A498IMC2_MALDO|nr:hypothetical protein DVH24_032982 [Malus domestica]
MEIIIAIASKIGESLVTPIGTEFGYLVNYHSNLESLRGEIKKLFDKKDEVQGLVDAAKRNGEIIKPDVQSWLKNVNDDMVKKMLQFEDEINKKRRCVYRWSLSRRAYKIKQEVLQLQNEGTFENVAHPAPPRGIWSKFKKGFKDFKSRMANMNEVIEGLKREQVRMIEICGMGGVGKTIMAKEIITRLAKLNLFDNIVMATVSQSPSIRTIQSDIASQIGLELKEESESGRAIKLHGKLMEIKILIVLDDVWTEPDFEAIGLPSGDAHKGCKVLLTSRDSDVCNRMGSQPIIEVPTLTTEESQELFREMVGESFDEPDLRSIAKEVVHECGGLPIAIVTVGKALEKKNKREWDDALNQLRNSTPMNIPGVNDKVYSSIKWSYDKLESDEARLCLLLCCLFPEDYDIPIEYLVRYGWGRGYFSSSFTLEDARNRVHSLVGQLKRRFLLLDSGKSEATKMHDVVRDVVIWIASRDPHGFLIRSDAENKGWPNLATYDHYTTISLVGDLEIQDGLKCPKLELLQTMEGLFSEGSMNNICKAMKELKVLALVGMEMKNRVSLRSLGLLKNLRTLCLDGSNFDGTSTDVIGSLENLEIFSFRDCDSMRELPREIGRLKQLRLLDTTNCEELEVIPHVARNLVQLQELNIDGCGQMEEIVSKQGREHEEEADMISFHKLTNLTLEGLGSLVGFFQAKKLYSNQEETTARVEHQSAGVFEKAIFPSKCISWLPSLEEVVLGRMKFERVLFDLKIHIVMDGQTAPTFPQLQYVFLHLIARELFNLEEVTPTNLEDSNDDDNLENLIVSDCNSMEVIFQLKGPKHEESSHSIEAFNKLSSLRLDRLPGLTRVWETGSSQPMLTGSSFGNLKSLEVGFCNQLKYLFSSSIVKLLVSIEDIEVHNCEKMEEIVAAEEETDETITLPKVKSIKLESLPKLKYFCGEAYTLKLPSLELLEFDDVQNLSLLAPKLIATHPRLQVRTALGVAEWKGDLNATLRNIYVTGSGGSTVGSMGSHDPLSERTKDAVKFKVRCSKYLYTLCVFDSEKVDDMGSDLPPVLAGIVQPLKGKLVWFLDKAAASKLDDGTQFSA